MSKSSRRAATLRYNAEIREISESGRMCDAMFVRFGWKMGLERCGIEGLGPDGLAPCGSGVGEAVRACGWAGWNSGGRVAGWMALRRGRLESIR